MGNELLAYFTRRRRVGSQIGVFVTPDGVAAAQVSAAAPSGKPRLERCVYEKRGAHDPFARVVGRLPNRRAPTVSVLDPGGYRLLLVEAPDVPADELRAAVRWRIKDLIDFHIDDAVIDVFEMPPHARGGPRRMMYAVTAKAEVVKQRDRAHRERRVSSSTSSTFPSSRCATSRRCSSPSSAARRSCT